MTLKRNLANVACSVSLVFFFGCSPTTLPELAPAPPVPSELASSALFDNVVCNHTFSQEQLASPPDIVENENSIIINLSLIHI